MLHSVITYILHILRISNESSMINVFPLCSKQTFLFHTLPVFSKFAPSDVMSPG